jgi:hypothetical protein
MKNAEYSVASSCWALLLAALLPLGCQSSKTQTTSTPAETPKPAAAPAAPAAAATPAPAAAPAPAEPAKAAESTSAAPGAIRIKAGSSSSMTDSSGNTWLADQGFDGGDVVGRADDLEIANTKDPALYRTEHYSMNSFSYKLPNGKYIVKLHFAETFEGIEGPNQRVFSFNVEGHEFKDFDVWVKAGGPRRAYIETVPVEIKDGKLDISFESKVENPEINGIEIIPSS